MYIKDKAALIAMIINEVAKSLNVKPSACLRKSSPHSQVSKARVFITHIMIRGFKLTYDDVIATLHYSDRGTVWYTLQSASKKLNSKPNAQLMHNICFTLTESLKNSKTSVHTAKSTLHFLKPSSHLISG